MFIPVLGRSPGEKMATHSSILAWRIPWTEEPSRLQSIGPQRQEPGEEAWLSLAVTLRPVALPPCLIFSICQMCVLGAPQGRVVLTGPGGWGPGCQSRV